MRLFIQQKPPPLRDTRNPALDEQQPNLGQLTRELRVYRSPRLGRSIFELLATLVPLIGIYTGLCIAIAARHYEFFALIVPAGFLLLRLFLIQHDCGHGAFFAERWANDWLGRLMGALILTPYDCWRRSHAMHHAGVGNLDARGFGDVDVLTLEEYRARSKPQRLLYRLYRHPAVLLGLGPAYLFLLRHRLPIGLMTAGKKYWLSAIFTNLGTATLVALLIFIWGSRVVALTLIPITLLAASAGVWLFYAQHQFELTSWDRARNWCFHKAALHGSTHLDLPPMLRWLTANVGIHHVHHLASRIPFYRLPEVLRGHPELAQMNRVTLGDTIRAFGLAVWDENRRRLIPLPATKMSSKL